MSSIQCCHSCSQRLTMSTHVFFFFQQQGPARHALHAHEEYAYVHVDWGEVHDAR